MPRAAQSYRIGGEACSPEALQAEARAAFLDVAAELYPVLDELLASPKPPACPSCAACHRAPSAPGLKAGLTRPRDGTG
jgi:hypothetical protein